jgi:hypothetical protein
MLKVRVPAWDRALKDGVYTDVTATNPVYITRERVILDFSLS